MTLKDQLLSTLTIVLQDFGLPDLSIQLDYPSDPKHGDYATNVALVAAKELGKNPMDLAETIAGKITALKEPFIESVDVVKPGFINFWISDKAFIQLLHDDIAFPNLGNGKEVVVEYSSPNIAKPFTIGHLRSTIIGDAIANLLEASGYKVHRDNHVGDWGTQFGKQIYAIKTWGNEEEIEKADRPVKLLVDLYVKFHEEAEKDPKLESIAREWFKKLEAGDGEARALWQKCIDWSWKEFDLIYQQLGVTFTENNGRGYGESFFEDKMEAVIEELEEKKLLQVGEDGAKLVFFPNEEFPPLMIIKKDGATLYATRDLATDKFRKEYYGRDLTIINEVGAEQTLYFRQLYRLEELLDWYTKDQRLHVKHGLYRFKDGKMSTRKGNVIWLEEVLEEAIKRAEVLAEGSGEKVGEIVGIGALKWNDLKRSPEQDIAFDWDEILNMQGNAGPYVQYTFARTQSVLAKVQSVSIQQSQDKKFTMQSNEEDFTMQPEERELLRLLSRFPEIVEQAAHRFAPNILCTYLFELAQSFNLFYQKCPILKAEKDMQAFRLSLTQATGATLRHGLTLLGIQAPQKM